MTELSQLFHRTYHAIKERGWTSKSRIIGEAIEDCVVTLPCPICKHTTMTKYKANEKSKDVRCNTCCAQIQIKGSKHTKKLLSPIKLLGAEYNTTCLSIKENMVHYLVILYSDTNDVYTINDILFIHRDHIHESCIIPRKKLSSTAKRAGWQGCTLVFDTFTSIYNSICK